MIIIINIIINNYMIKNKLKNLNLIQIFFDLFIIFLKQFQKYNFDTNIFNLFIIYNNIIIYNG